MGDQYDGTNGNGYQPKPWDGANRPPPRYPSKDPKETPCPAEAAKNADSGSNSKPPSPESEPRPSLLVLSVSEYLSESQTDMLYQGLQPICDELGMKALIVQKGMKVALHHDLTPVLAEFQAMSAAVTALADQVAKAIEQNATLLQAMAEQDRDEDGPQSHYLSGAPVTL